MRKVLVFLMAVFFMFAAGCGSSSDHSGSTNDDTTVLSSENGVTSFTLEGIEGEIDLEAGTIAVYLPYGPDVASLVASFVTTGESVSVGSTVQVSGTTANDFSSPVTYTVTAEDGTTRTFTVTVIELGRYQAFESIASNLLDGATVSTTNRQIYLHDLKTGENTLVSEGIDGYPADSNNSCSGGTVRPSVTPDGRYVVFDSNATNLADLTFGGYKQVYLKDMQTGETTLVSTAYDGNMSNGLSRSASISDDGNYIAFIGGYVPNLIEGVTGSNSLAYLYERETGGISLVSETYDGNPADACLVYVAISGNGRYAVFTTEAGDIVEGVSSSVVQVYRRDLETGITSLVSVGYDGSSPGDNGSYETSVSEDGRYIAFASNAANLIDGFAGSSYRQIFLRDMETGATSLVSVGYDGNPASNYCYAPHISSDGSHVAFESEAGNLVDGVSPGYDQAFLRDIEAGTTSLASVGYDGSPASGDVDYPLVSSDGRFVFFASDGANLLDGDDADNYHVYARDMTAGTISKMDANAAGEEGDGDAYTNHN